MSTHTAHFGIGLPRLHRAPTLPQASRPAPTAARARPWLERLAAWSERQPQHHRLGSWTRL